MYYVIYLQIFCALIENKRGSRIDSCGTPEVACVVFERDTATIASKSIWGAIVHKNYKDQRIDKRSLWFRILNAFGKSSRIKTLIVLSLKA